MFWDDAEPTKKDKKEKEEGKEGENLDDIGKKGDGGGGTQEGTDNKGFFGGLFGSSPSKEPEDPDKASDVPPEKGKEKVAPPKPNASPEKMPFKDVSQGKPNDVQPPKTEAPNLPNDNIPSKAKESPVPNAEGNKNSPKGVAPPKKEAAKKDAPAEKSVYVDPEAEEEPEYGFIPTKREEEPKECVFLSIISLVASAPIIVSFLSISHIIRRIPTAYLVVGCLLFSIHLFLSLLVTADCIKNEESIDESYTTISSKCFPLSLAINLYLCLLKYLTCIFLLDMFLETVYSIFPDIRPARLSLSLSTLLVLLFVTVLLVGLTILRKSVFVALQGFNFALVVGGLSFLVCVSIYSKHVPINPDNGIEFKLPTVSFLLLAFLSFSCEIQSASVLVFKRALASPFTVSLASVSIITLFFIALSYLGKWILYNNLFTTINLIVPYYSDLNQSLQESQVDSYNLLSYVSLVSCLLISLIGFVIQMKILSRSMISILTFLQNASSIVGILFISLVVASLVVLVIVNDIGRLLWWSTRIIFFCAPFYAMYPYVATIVNKSENKLYFIMSIVMVLVLCVFVFLSFYCVSVLNSSVMR